MFEIKVLPLGDLQANCYLLYDGENGSGVLFDPGAQAQDILAWVGAIKVSHILVTHGHHDHVGALHVVREALDAPVGIHPADSRQFHVPSDFYLNEGMELELADETWLQVAYLPGHTPGSVGFYLTGPLAPPAAIVGDSIFPGGPGHTGSPEDLIAALDNLERKVFAWPDETTLYPGHGAPTTVGAERPAFEAFRRKPLPDGLFGDVTW